MKYYNTDQGKYPEEKSNNDTANEFWGNGWNIKKDNNIFKLTYISGSLQGKMKSIEITESDFIAAKEGKMNLDDFCIKYNVF